MRNFGRIVLTLSRGCTADLPIDDITQVFAQSTEFGAIVICHGVGFVVKETPKKVYALIEAHRRVHVPSEKPCWEKPETKRRTP